MKKIFVFVILGMFYGHAICQSVLESGETLVSGEGEIKVVVAGTGPEKQKALENAFENAIIEALGTFVSANTIIENDNLIRDEILLYSKGFIKAFKILLSEEVKDGISLTISAIVTRNQVYESVKAKGINIKYDPSSMIYKVNEWKILHDREFTMLEKLLDNELRKVHENLYDYTLEAKDAVLKANNYLLPLEVNLKANANLKSEIDNLKIILSELCLDKVERYMAIGKRNLYGGVPAANFVFADTVVGRKQNKAYKYCFSINNNGGIYDSQAHMLTEKDFNKLIATESITLEIRRGSQTNSAQNPLWVEDIFKESDYTPFYVALNEEFEDNQFLKRMIPFKYNPHNIPSNIINPYTITSYDMLPNLQKVIFYKFINKSSVGLIQMYVDFLNTLVGFDLKFNESDTARSHSLKYPLIYYTNNGYGQDLRHRKVEIRHKHLSDPYSTAFSFNQPYYAYYASDASKEKPMPPLCLMIYPDYQQEGKVTVNLSFSEDEFKNVTNLIISPSSPKSYQLVGPIVELDPGSVFRKYYFIDPLHESLFLFDKRDSTIYQTVHVAGKVWMLENLRRFVEVDFGMRFKKDEYDWHEANLVCPSGWHLPTVQEWNLLIENFEDPSKGPAIITKKKSLKLRGDFFPQNIVVDRWWSANEVNESDAIVLKSYGNRTGHYISFEDKDKKQNKDYVRCVKD